MMWMNDTLAFVDLPSTLLDLEMRNVIEGVGLCLLGVWGVTILGGQLEGCFVLWQGSVFFC